MSATPIPDGAAFSVIATGRARNRLSISRIRPRPRWSPTRPRNIERHTPRVTPRRFTTSTARNRAARPRQGDRTEAPERTIDNATATEPTDPALEQAQANAGLAQGRANALAAAYTQALENQQPPGTMLSPLASALSASSDRKHKLELFGFVGLATGSADRVGDCRDARAAPSPTDRGPLSAMADIEQGHRWSVRRELRWR